MPSAPYDDHELLQAARSGDSAALEELYRLHRPAALRAAARLCGPSEIDDVVSDAFLRVFTQLERGGGPRVAFRAYLMTAVRSAHADLVRRDAPLVWTEQPEDRETSAPVDAGSREHAESHVLAEALAVLPDRSQLVLWWAIVEGRPLHEIGVSLGLNANAVAALAFRAREALRTSYLKLHVEAAPSAECAPWREQLPAYVRDRLREAVRELLEEHLDSCESCAQVTEELRQLLSALTR